MPIGIDIIRAREFICVNALEQLDFEASKNVLQGVAMACRKRGLNQAMLDLRALPVPDKPLFTSSELARLVGTFREAGFSQQQRLAVLFLKDVHRGIRTFAFLSKLRGLEVEAFDDFERAILWLSEEFAEEQGGVPVRIVNRKAKKRTELSNAGTRQAVRIRSKSRAISTRRSYERTR